MRKPLLTVVAVAVLAAAALSACGQKGPLYLPAESAGQTPTR